MRAKNKNTGLYIILVILIAIASYFVKTSSTTTIKGEYSDFAVEDTASVTKIFLVDKEGNKVLLDRKDGYWTVNNKYRCRKDAIDVLLTTMKDIQVKAPIPKTELDEQIKRLAAKSTKVEIYKNNENKPYKVYYVGGATTNHQGTYMLMENSTKPYILHIPGFLGYLSTRYFTDEILWRENWIFRSSYDNIASVSLDYPKNPEKSFTAVNLTNNKFELYRNIDSTKIDNFDTVQVKLFISHFMKFGYEAPVTKMKKRKRDSLLSVKPEKIYTVKLRKDNFVRSLYLYKVKGDTILHDSFGHEVEFDPDRMYGFYDNFKELVTVQTKTINPATKELNDFIKK